MKVTRSRLGLVGSLAVALSLLASSGCETSDATLRETGRSEAYITGFHDGRHSGMKEAGNYLEHMVKDSKRFDEDAEYRAGWLAGEQEGMRMQQQANAAVGGAAGYQISKDAQKSSKHDIDKAIKSGTKDIDTGSLKSLEN